MYAFLVDTITLIVSTCNMNTFSCFPLFIIKASSLLKNSDEINYYYYYKSIILSGFFTAFHRPLLLTDIFVGGGEREEREREREREREKRERERECVYVCVLGLNK